MLQNRGAGTPSSSRWTDRLPRLFPWRRRPASLRPGPLLLDDVFPLRLSAFRIAEFNAVLRRFPDALVRTTARGFAALGETRGFEKVLRDYAREFPNLADRVALLEAGRRVEARAAYMVFLNNARAFLPLLEKRRVPFAFTLYPGGGFHLEEKAADESLKRVLGSRWFRQVIATQTITRDYLLSRRLCDPAAITFVYGGVFPSDYYAAHRPARRRYGLDKATLDVCFVANRYTPDGADKGYDLFLEAARGLARRLPAARFHVVGPWEPAHGDAGAIADRITFHGSRTTDFFPSFYAGMDLILSPNRAFAQGAGRFDGFPTGCCIEAGLCGVAVLASDPLGLNQFLEDGRDLVLVPADGRAILERVLDLAARPEALAALGDGARAAFGRLFDVEAQVAPRLRVLAALSGTHEASRAGAEA